MDCVDCYSAFPTTKLKPLQNSKQPCHYLSPNMNDQEAFAIAVEEAKLSYHEGGVPIGAALISREGKLLGRFVVEELGKASWLSPISSALLGLLED